MVFMQPVYYDTGSSARQVGDDPLVMGLNLLLSCSKNSQSACMGGEKGARTFC